MANITRNQLNMHHLKDSLNVNHCRTSTRDSAVINIEANLCTVLTTCRPTFYSKLLSERHSIMYEWLSTCYVFTVHGGHCLMFYFS